MLTEFYICTVVLSEGRIWGGIYAECRWNHPVTVLQKVAKRTLSICSAALASFHVDDAHTCRRTATNIIE